MYQYNVIAQDLNNRFQIEVQSPMKRLSMGESFLTENILVREVVNKAKNKRHWRG